MSFLPASIVPVKLVGWFIGIGGACYFWIWVPRIFRGGSGKNGTTIAVSYFIVAIIHLARTQNFQKNSYSLPPDTQEILVKKC